MTARAQIYEAAVLLAVFAALLLLAYVARFDALPNLFPL